MFVGIDEPVPVLDGRLVPYVNLDNAASTPPLVAVVETIDRFLPYYSGVHRGTGYKSRVSTAAFESSRAVVGEFVGADPDRDVVVFTKNTTEAINKLARSLPIGDGEIVLTTFLEHHSNDLPWRSNSRCVHVRACADGTLDEDHLDRLLAEFHGRIALLAVSGASNVTGVVQPIHRLARKVHAAGGRILVDAAQLAAHRPIDMRAHDDPTHLDFLALSAHKAYAPFGSGALIGPRAAFGATPDHRGGGTVHAVTLDEVAWAELPDREEAGSPNVVGAVALAAALSTLAEIGRGRIAAHEADLLRYATERLRRVPGLHLYGPTDPPGCGHGWASSRSTSAASTTASSRRCSGTNTVSAPATAASAPTRTSPTCSVSTGPSSTRGRSALAAATCATRPAWCASASVATTTRPMSIVRRARSNASPTGDIAGSYRCDDDGEHHPIAYREPMPRLFTMMGGAGR